MRAGAASKNLASLIRDYCDYTSGAGGVLDLVLKPEFVLVKAAHGLRPLTKDLVATMPAHPADGILEFQKARIIREFIHNHLIPLHVAGSYHGCISSETLKLDLQGKVCYESPFNGCTNIATVERVCRLYGLDARVSPLKMLSAASHPDFRYPLTKVRYEGWMKEHPGAAPYASFFQRADVYSTLQLLFYLCYGKTFPFSSAKKGTDGRLEGYFKDCDVPEYQQDLVSKALALELSAQDLECSFALKSLREHPIGNNQAKGQERRVYQNRVSSGACESEKCAEPYAGL